MSNNILNYFKKVDTNKTTPLKSNELIKNEAKSSPSAVVANNGKTDSPSLKKSTIKNEIKKEEKENSKMEVDLYDNENDEEEIIRPISKVKRSIGHKDSPRDTKRRRLTIQSDDEDESEDEVQKTKKSKSKGKKTSDDEYKVDDDEEEGDDDFIDDDDDFIDDGSDEENVKPKKTPKKTVISKRGLSKSTASPRGGKSAKSATNSPAPKSNASSGLDAFAAANADQDSNGPIDITKYKHMNYEFLKDDKIKDINGNKKDDPNYDPRTLYVPPDFKKSCTPALRQWWELKSTNFDVLFFFKVGKFYELYHQDAVIAVKELGLSFMRGDYAHCGFPEIAFSRFADALVSKGYKVGRVEQTETPEMMTERVKGTKQDKTVRREICRITTPGTKTFNVLDSDATNAFSQYLYSIIERINTIQEKKVRTYGICFLDTTVGKIFIGQFEDDRNCSKLRTTFAQYPPAHILYEKGTLSKESKNIIDLQNGLKEGLSHENEMFSTSKILRLLSESDYFKQDNKTNQDFNWPENFKPLLSDHDSLGLTAKHEYDLAVNALGGVVWCLKKCLIDNEILSMKNFEIYQPVDNILTNDVKKNEMKNKLATQKYMVLDSISLTNLEVIENNYDSTQSGTLYEQLDFCCTNFGKRLLKYWIVNPLCNPDAINERLDAIEDLKSMNDKLDKMRDQLKLLPDLERLISKIHQLGNVRKDHPESRAIMYENDVYSKKKIEDFISILNGFANANKLLISLKEVKFKSNLLKSILTINTNVENKRTGFPYLDELLKFYNESFDADKAKAEGKIIPTPGVNEEYDSAINDLKESEKKLQSYLKQKIKEFNCTLIYFGSNKTRYQLEIPEHKCNKLSSDYELMSSKKGFKRYWTPEIKEYLQELTDAETRRDQALRDTTKSLFKSFDKHYNVWNRAVQCLSILDVMVSLTTYVRNSPDVVCRPEFIILDESSTTKSPFIEIINGRHPCLSKTFSGDFIPNDVLIGCEDANNNWQKHPLLILTGPNMGGKSTLMRQTGLTVILAQMGCYVPAEKCKLSPVDRIFTRIGASDKILAGESTFYLELSETASILHHASKHSLVLMDELGRGTATFDGTAIAYSVVKELAQRINCRTLFSTHYHHLVEEFSHDDNVSMGHMQSIVNDDDQSITFLYKFGEGACPKSHGFNAARLADIPDEIIKIGSVKAIEFENFTRRIQLLKKLIHLKSKSELNDLIQKFEELTSK